MDGVTESMHILIKENKVLWNKRHVPWLLNKNFYRAKLG
jgi:hypothetical protein